MKLRVPLITFERIKRTVLLAGFAGLMEWSSPEVFFGTWLSKAISVLIVAEVILQVWIARQETSMSAVITQRTMAVRWAQWRQRFPADFRYRIRRLSMILAFLMVYGQLLNLSTDACSNAINCVLRTPILAIEMLPFFLYIAFTLMMSMIQIMGMFYLMTKVGFTKTMMPGTMDVTFDDIYGQDKAVSTMKEQVNLLNSDAEVKLAGGFMPNGILLWGPPGTGKTMLAKAVANASTKPVIIVPPGGFASTFVGINFLKVFMLFRMVRKYSRRYKGVIVFMDEIDSLGNRGGEVAGEDPNEIVRPEFGCSYDHSALARYHEELRVAQVPGLASSPANWVIRSINQLTLNMIGNFSGSNPGTLEAFLAALDGMDESRGLINKVLVSLGFPPLAPPIIRRMFIGATNMPSKVDKALTRPGRLSRKVHVDYVDHAGKIATYQGYLGKVNHSITDEELERMVRNHQPATGAEVQAIVNEAVLATFREEDAESGLVTYEGLAAQLRIELVGEPGDAFEVPLNRWWVAVHEAGHAVMAHHKLRHLSDIWFGTIVSHGQSGGMVAVAPHTDDWLLNKVDMEYLIMMYLSSRVSESIFFGMPSNGQAGDGKAASGMAMSMVRYGHHVAQIGAWWDLGSPNYTDMAEEILHSQLILAHDFLYERQDQIEAVAALLIRDETVDGTIIHDMLDDMEDVRICLEHDPDWVDEWQIEGDSVTGVEGDSVT